MIHRTYTDFIDKFECLTPYELDHFCNIVHEHFHAIMQRPEQVAKDAVTHGDMKEILIRSMQAAQLDLAERKLKDAEYNLQLVKSRMYKK